ncbi:MAG: sugar ABC transporter permease [Oscillochloris sp.]|nr:sugar ABC transporter permease [Oscillochloris sp.]
MQTTVQKQVAVRPTLRQRLQRMGEAPFGLLLLAPAALVLLLFLISPLIYALLMSLQQIELTISPDWRWAGLENYAALLGERAVRESLGRTLVFAALTISISVVLALGLALLLNEPFRGRGMARVLVLLPWAVAPVVAGVLWRYLFHSNYGLVNALLFQLGLIPAYQVWLDNASVAILIAALATAWKSLPFLALILLARLQSIPEALYRAARMDGAGAWARFRYVTMPHLRGMLIFAVVMQTIIALQSFDLIFTLTRGGPGQGTVVLSYLVFINAFERLSMGRAAAMAVLLALLIVLLGTLAPLLAAERRRKEPQDA